MGSSLGVYRSSFSPNQIGTTATPLQPKQPTRVESRCIPQTAQGTISFEVTGYRQLATAFPGQFIRSSSLNVGGYSWCLRFYPDNNGFVKVYLELLTKNVEVKALQDFSLVDLTTGTPSVIFRNREPRLFNTVDASKNEHTWGPKTIKFLERKELEASSVYLRDDRLVIECDITVVNEPLVVERMRTTSAAEELHRNLSRDFANLLESMEGADVTFEVQGEVVAAHTIVLAARSPVLKARFYGPLREQIADGHILTIEDMQPAVFKALLYFIYTDSMSPTMDGLDGDEKKELAKHLLVAGDRYDIQGLRFACETNLCESLDVSTVADVLAFADQHSCTKLKDACIEFIACTDKMDDLVASNGYDHLKSSCPDVFVDLFEKAARSRKI